MKNFLQNLFDLKQIPKNKYFYILDIFCLNVILFFLLGLVSIFIVLITGVDLESLPKNSTDNLIGDSFWFGIFTICVVAPIMEELLFRTILSKKLPTIWFGSCLLLLGLLILDWIYAVASLIVWIYLIIKKPKKTALPFVIFTSLVFALVHIGNFSTIGAYNPLVLIMILPYVLFGYILGITRVKLGLIWSILLHFLINFKSVIVDIAVLFSTNELGAEIIFSLGLPLISMVYIHSRNNNFEKQ